MLHRICFGISLAAMLLVSAAVVVVSTLFVSAASQVTPTAASATTIFQLQVWQLPQVPYQEVYTTAAKQVNGTPFCKSFGGFHPHGEVNSFENARKAIASVVDSTLLPLSWIYVFPNDGYISRLLVKRSSGWNPIQTTAAAAATTAGNTTTSVATTSSTTTTTTSSTTTVTSTTTSTTTITSNGTSIEPSTTATTTDSTTAGPSTPSSPSTGPRTIEDLSAYPTTFVYAVWVLVHPLNGTSASITSLEREKANRELLKLSTNIGDPAPLAAAIGDSSFFAFNAVDFQTSLNIESMETQKQAMKSQFLKVYDDEWNKFLIGMIATTLLGTAAYITAHCFIHRVPRAPGDIITEKSAAEEMVPKAAKPKPDANSAAAAVAGGSEGAPPSATAATAS